MTKRLSAAPSRLLGNKTIKKSLQQQGCCCAQVYDWVRETLREGDDLSFCTVHISDFCRNEIVPSLWSDRTYIHTLLLPLLLM